MARRVKEIKDQMTSGYIANPIVIALYGIDTSKTFDEQFSAVSIESILFYTIAYAIWLLEKLFDTHKNEVLNIIDNLKPHSVKWYAEKAKDFQYGFDLLPDSDKFNNDGKTSEQIETSKIVKYSAVIEQENKLLMKVAKLSGNDLAPLPADELAAFEYFVNRYRDAGVKVELLTMEADKLRLELTVYYNPLVLRADGSRIDDGSMPVPATVKSYASGIIFDGTFVLAKMVDALQMVEGVEIPHVVSSAYKYGALDWVYFDVMYRPISGYTRIDDADMIINYIPKSTI